MALGAIMVKPTRSLLFVLCKEITWSQNLLLDLLQIFQPSALSINKDDNIHK